MPSVLGRIVGGMGSRFDRHDQRVSERLHDGTPRILASLEPGVQPTSRSNAALPDSTASILSAGQFACFLERECSLADRGTRRLSLLALRRRAGERGVPRGCDVLGELARHVRKHLRSTDLVGQLGADRVEILLTDTEPAGARVVAAWVEQVVAELGLDLEQTIYVYPFVEEPIPERDQDGGPPQGGPHDVVHSNGNGNGRLTRPGDSAANVHVAPGPEDGVATNGKAVGGHLDGHAVRGPHGATARTDRVVPDGRWPMEDLWPLLGVPTPLWKRSLDLLISALALLVLLPLLVLIAIAIRLDSPGPAIFRQVRAGRGARPFLFYKFRSMTVDAEMRRAALAAQNEQDGPIFKIRADPRITRVGRLLRRWSIDELPQLWNVLKGDISLVGPRSPLLDEVCKYESWQRRRLCVTGGITCIWQVSGRSRIPFRDWMRLDRRPPL